MIEKFISCGVKVTAVQFIDEDDVRIVNRICELVGVPGARVMDNRIRFGLAGAWMSLYKSQWVVRFGSEIYDHIFLDDKVFKALFTEVS